MAKPVKRQTWGNIDVFGLLNGIATWDDQYKSLKYVRVPSETAIELRNKIYRHHDYSGGITQQGIINGISNEFNITPYNVTTKNIFILTYYPEPIGPKNSQDISGFYKDSSGNWLNLKPQVWSSGYLTYKNSKTGFIVWENERSNNISGVKNFSYSNLVEVFEELDDNTELKFIYYTYTHDENNNRQLIKFTDMNCQTDPYDKRFTYRKNVCPPSGSVIAYNLTTIPTGLYSGYYNTKGQAQSLLYTLKEHVNRKYKHKWNQISDNACIWDVQRLYGSGEIPHFFDAIAPRNIYGCPNSTGFFESFIGGIENKSDSLFPQEVVESGDVQNWYLKVYPGKFYVDGIPFYLFENPSGTTLTFNKVLNTYIYDPISYGSLHSWWDSSFSGNYSGVNYYDEWVAKEPDTDSSSEIMLKGSGSLTGDFDLEFGVKFLTASALDTGIEIYESNGTGLLLYPNFYGNATERARLSSDYFSTESNVIEVGSGYNVYFKVNRTNGLITAQYNPLSSGWLDFTNNYTYSGAVQLKAKGRYNGFTYFDFKAETGLPYEDENKNMHYATLPSGVQRGAHTILAITGYYDNPCESVDPYLSGFVYEDYHYPVGEDAEAEWSNIYRRRPYLTSNTGNKIILDYGQYNIDYKNKKVYTYNTSGAYFIWENNILPSGRAIAYDINPLNNQDIALEGFFMYLSLNKDEL